MFSAWKKSSNNAQPTGTPCPSYPSDVRFSQARAPSTSSTPAHFVRMGANIGAGVGVGSSRLPNSPPPSTTTPLSSKKVQALPNGWTMGIARPLSVASSPPKPKPQPSISPSSPPPLISKQELGLDLSLIAAPTARRYTETTVTTFSNNTSNSNNAGGLRPPASPTEQYWAARALKAEALLGAQERHQKELKEILEQEDAKRQRELAAIERHHKEKHTSLERLVTLLIASIFLLISIIIYLAIHPTLTSSRKRNSSMLHFTIPVLSPFTSVVENETSVMGTKALVGLFLSIALLAYMLIRHRLPRSLNII